MKHSPMKSFKREIIVVAILLIVFPLLLALGTPHDTFTLICLLINTGIQLLAMKFKLQFAEQLYKAEKEYWMMTGKLEALEEVQNSITKINP